jgi:uncharacterized membrane protein
VSPWNFSGPDTGSGFEDFRIAVIDAQQLPLKLTIQRHPNWSVASRSTFLAEIPPMARRAGKGSLHHLFQAAVVVKGVDGVLELIGGALLFFVSPSTLHRLVAVLTQHELAEEADDWLVMALRRLAESLSMETRQFASAYLIGHGLLKVFLAVSLLRERLWAFPLALSVLTLFVAYQLHRFSRTHSTVLLALTVLDMVVMVLIWREYRSRTEIVRPSDTAKLRDP